MGVHWNTLLLIKEKKNIDIKNIQKKLCKSLTDPLVVRSFSDFLSPNGFVKTVILIFTFNFDPIKFFI